MLKVLVAGNSASILEGLEGMSRSFKGVKIIGSMKKLLLIALLISSVCVFAQTTGGNAGLPVYTPYYKGDTTIHSVDTMPERFQEKIERGDSKAWVISAMGQPLTKWIYGDKRQEKWEYSNKLVFLRNDYVVFIHTKTVKTNIPQNELALKHTAG